MIITIIQTIIAALLIGCILMQAQGSGLSAGFGGTGEFYRSKRSVEKLLMYATVALATIFAGISIALLLFPH
jgi:protein translocase SecG subunit